jgi:hypothetical protein
MVQSVENIVSLYHLRVNRISSDLQLCISNIINDNAQEGHPLLPALCTCKLDYPLRFRVTFQLLVFGCCCLQPEASQYS